MTWLLFDDEPPVHGLFRRSRGPHTGLFDESRVQERHAHHYDDCSGFEPRWRAKQQWLTPREREQRWKRQQQMQQQRAEQLRTQQLRAKHHRAQEEHRELQRRQLRRHLFHQQQLQAENERRKLDENRRQQLLLHRQEQQRQQRQQLLRAASEGQQCPHHQQKQQRQQHQEQGPGLGVEGSARSPSAGAGPYAKDAEHGASTLSQPLSRHPSVVIEEIPHELRVPLHRRLSDSSPFVLEEIIDHPALLAAAC